MPKHSQFNHLAQLPDESAWALVNFAYGSATRLDAAQKAVFDMAQTLHSDAPLVRSWLRQGFLVDEGFDEVAAVRERVDGARENGTNIRCSPSRVKKTAASLARGDTTPTISEAEYEQTLAMTGLPSKLRAFNPILAPCQAALPNEVHIDELGNIFPHCSFYSADPAYSIGNLLDDDGGAPDAWLGALGSRAQDLCFPSDQPQCLECKFLPCCLGGCPMQRIEGGKPECPSALFDPNSFAIERLTKTTHHPTPPTS